MSIGPVYRCLLEIARERGVDTDALLAEIGFTQESLLAPEARLSPELGRGLATKLVQQTGDPELGLCAAERFRLADLDLLGYLAWHSESLPAMFDALAKYARLIGDTAAASVAQGVGTITLTLGRTGGRILLPEGSDFFVGILARLVREWSKGTAQLIGVQLPRGRPRSPASYDRFFGVAVSFGAPEGALTYRNPATAAVRAETDRDLGGILRRQAERALAALPPDASLAERARAQLGQQLERGGAGLSEIAAQLGTSERSLRRHLREAGTGYRELVDDERRERALMLAHEGVHSVTAIAMQVGFADLTAFSRAFRRWTGSLPSDYLQSSRERGK